MADFDQPGLRILRGRPMHAGMHAHKAHTNTPSTHFRPSFAANDGRSTAWRQREIFEKFLSGCWCVCCYVGTTLKHGAKALHDLPSRVLINTVR
jgi:hypothetical protein